MRKRRILSLLLAVAVTATMLIAVPLTASAASTVDNLKTIDVATILYADDWNGLEVNDNNTVKVEPTALSANTLYDADRILCIGATGAPATNKGDSDLGGRHYFNSVRIKGTGQIAFKVNSGAKVTVYTEKHSSRYLKAGTTDDGSDLGTQNINTNSFTFTHTQGGLVYLTSNNNNDQLYLGAISVEYPDSKTPGISVSPSSKTILVGDSFKIFTNIQNKGDATVSWSSETDGIVDLESQTDESVTVKGKSSGSTNSGSTIIKATINVGGQDYTASCAVTVEKVYNITFDISEVEEAEGKAPNAIKVKVGEQVTIPENKTLYVEGKTLTGWKDDNTTYDCGKSFTPEKDTILKPVFTDNKVKLGDAASNVTFQFRKDQGAPEIALEYNPNDKGIVVAQTTINDEKIDVKLDVDTLNGTGKFNNSNHTNCIQCNDGTRLYVPVIDGSTIEVTTNSDSSKFTLDGEATDVTKDPITVNHFGKSEIIAGTLSDGAYKGGGTWWQHITVTYPEITALTGEQNHTSGAYTSGEATKGVIRFFQQCAEAGEPITKYGFIFADKDGNFVGGGNYEVSGENLNTTDPGFYADLYDIDRSVNDAVFHAKAYVVVDGVTKWADVYNASVDWSNQLKSYTPGE